MKKQIFFGTMLLAGLMTSCKDENVSETFVPEANVSEEVYSIRLVDESGNEVTSLNGDFAQLYAEVEAEGEWCLSTNNPNIVYLTTEVGSGNGRVPVFITTCWAEDRQFSIEATPRSLFNPAASRAAATRADDTPGTSTGSITQTKTYDLSTVADRLSSNMGAGFSVSIASSNNVLLKTQMQIFNLRGLKALSDSFGVTLLEDALSPQMEQKYVVANSKKELRDQVTVGINGKIGSGGLEGSNISGDVTVSDNADSSSYYAARRQLSKLFTRHINYADIAALEAQEPNARGKALAPGFRMMRDTLQSELLRHHIANPDSMTSADSVRCYHLVDAFIREVGPNFICKASMGCALDYYIKVDSSDMKKGLTVNAVLDVKYESQVKDTTTNAVTDSTKFSVGGDAEVLKYAKEAAQKSEVEVVLNGGDVSQVDILCNGGQLTTADIQKWQRSISPEMSVMVDMEIVPISALFWEENVKVFIYDYLVRQGLTERYYDQVFKSNK